MIKSILKTQIHNEQISEKRVKCIVCDHLINENDKSAFATFACNLRAFKHETFNVWRCPKCQTINCLEVVDLPHYYAKYPIAQAKLTWQYRLIYQNLTRRLTKHGFSKNHSLLDYGCANGLFLEYLRQHGFTNCHGYDLYAPQDGFGDRTTLQRGPFDYILLQEVIEHVEDPNTLLSELDSLLAPGGHILIGTPNAAHLDLNKPNVSDFYNQVHVPYHLHIYTREALESLGHLQGWKPVDFFDRSYYDTPWFSMNTRAFNQYQNLFDGSIDVVYESIQPWKALTSYKFWFYSLFGYWLSFRTGMAVMFRKS
ncbi:MAG: class I SAM-dependent methyltransferase [Komarekiella atlantica HA4396-MV6]|jgi:SAM-dependent methyltransferase|nr:class I SAM-dependent methyltransferase [Komarekiella atlantica HA4396-MV6]